MSGKEINRYLTLASRRLFIMVHSGVDLRPEYGAELENIDKEIADLSKLVDRELERRRIASGMC